MARRPSINRRDPGLTPGAESRAGIMFDLVRQDDYPRRVDYTYDATDRPGVVIVLDGWTDEYGGSACASRTFYGEPIRNDDGSWSLGKGAKLLPSYKPDRTPRGSRADARKYAQFDSLSHPGD